MLSTIIAASLLTPTYFFEPGKTQVYDLSATFNGFLPLMGGQESKIVANFGMKVSGETPNKELKPRASVDLTSFSATLDGTVLPFTIDNVRAYFPKTTLSYSPGGKVLSTNAPDLVLPIRLPGLDAKHLPELVVLPVEFPENGVDTGQSWAFEKQLGDGIAKFSVTVDGVQGDELSATLTATQDFEYLEDEALQVPKDPKEAVSKVHTILKGNGKVVFRLKERSLKSYFLKGLATSEVTPIKGGASATRKLEIELKVARTTEAKQVAVERVRVEEQPAPWLSKLRLMANMASKAVTNSVSGLLAQIVALFGTR